MLNHLKLLVIADVDDTSELILIQNQLKILDAGYQELKISTPEFVLEKLAQVNAAIYNSVKAQLAHRLKHATARREALRTADEKRNSLDAEIAELNSQLGT